MQNYFSGYKRRTSPSPALTGLHGQVGPNAPQLIWKESVSVDENSENWAVPLLFSSKWVPR